MKSQLLSGACALALSACATTQTPLPDTAALEAVATSGAASPIRPQDPFAGYTYRGPTGPRDWREVNQEQVEGK
ncbi:MAG: hypothetical protein ACJAXK_003198 [Yoonia sp.]|jgi:hypothetical protein